jgi:hypothetical protein
VSVPLKDFRCAITESIDIWLESVAQANGTDKQTVARDVLKAWARRKAHEHRVAGRLHAANGLQMDLDGIGTGDDGAGR